MRKKKERGIQLPGTVSSVYYDTMIKMLRIPTPSVRRASRASLDRVLSLVLSRCQQAVVRCGEVGEVW